MTFLSKNVMHILGVIEGFIPTKNTTNYTFFALSILVSFCIHLVIVLFITDSTYSCSDCDKISEIKTKSLSIQLYKKPEFKPLVEIVEDVIKQQSEPLIEIIKSTETPLDPPKPIVESITSSISNIKKINYAILTSSIKSVVNEDSLKYQQALQESCKNIKRSPGKTNCVPIIERLGYNADDPYDLAKIFSRLTNHSSSKQQERILAQLISKQDTMVAILESENLDEETRAIFSNELAHLRDETQYQDCDGNLNSGNCAGEADLFKAASLLLTLFEKVVLQ